MPDFCLHKYTTFESTAFGHVAPHKYRHPALKANQKTYIDAWTKDKVKIKTSFLNNLQKYFKVDEPFLLFTPPSNTKLFVNDVIEAIKNKYSNCVDLTSCFGKNINVRFGDARFKDFTPEQLLQFITVDLSLTQNTDKKISRAFIIDDVYSSGKSMQLTKLLIGNNFSQILEIKTGVILTIDENTNPKKDQKSIVDATLKGIQDHCDIYIKDHSEEIIKTIDANISEITGSFTEFNINNIPAKSWGVYVFYIKLKNDITTFDEWNTLWVKNQLQSPKAIKSKFRELVKDTWHCMYLGKSENLVSRITQHIHQKTAYTTYGLKISEHDSLHKIAGFAYSKYIIKENPNDNKDGLRCLTVTLERYLRNKLLPLIGKQ